MRVNSEVRVLPRGGGFLWLVQIGRICVVIVICGIIYQWLCSHSLCASVCLSVCLNLSASFLWMLSSLFLCIYCWGLFWWEKIYSLQIRRTRDAKNCTHNFYKYPAASSVAKTKVITFLQNKIVGFLLGASSPFTMSVRMLKIKLYQK